ncbi:hypothetical protein N0V93_002168 [Gnomoniopsis smithogilvyi]|uniref:Uncharacterized protein n=1 Tax=Gnomoniopsis smithogilvyi TaxID=1191159 RepID=A0A9W8YVZ9_9PEZI|nr:hypothetical protein N0V93_002168 [Gnomoniopsis smithogilvyi]
MEVRNGKTTVWVPREAFDSVQRLWKPEFNWIPVPVDRSLPPSHIAYIETNGPVSPLPPLKKPPKTPVSPLKPSDALTPLPPLTPLNTVPKTPRTPRGLPPLNTGSLRPEEPDYFGRSPELETAITAGFSPGDSDTPSTPSTATEPESPSTPKDIGSPGLSDPKIWRQSRQQPLHDAQDNESPKVDPVPQPSQPSQLPLNDYASMPWKMYENDGDKWKMVDHRPEYRPAHAGVKPASWKRLDGKRDIKMNDHWQTRKRDEAHWNGSQKGFAVRLDMHLEMEVEIKGTMNGDITLSAEALYVSSPI